LYFPALAKKQTSLPEKTLGTRFPQSPRSRLRPKSVTINHINIAFISQEWVLFCQQRSVDYE